MTIPRGRGRAWERKFAERVPEFSRELVDMPAISGGETRMESPSLVGKALPVFGVVPAGGLKFNETMIIALPEGDVGYDHPVFLGEWSPPVGKVAIIEQWATKYNPMAGGVVADPLLELTLRLDDVNDPGNTGVRSGLSSKINLAHIVLDSSMKLEVWGQYDASQFTPGFVQWVEVTLSGLLLLPNNMAVKYTELEGAR